MFGLFLGNGQVAVSPAHLVFNDRRMIRFSSGPFQGTLADEPREFVDDCLSNLVHHLVSKHVLVRHKGLYLLSEKIVIFENLSLPDSSIKINGLVRTIKSWSGTRFPFSFPNDIRMSGESGLPLI